MIDFVQGEVRKLFRDAQTRADGFKAELFDKLDGVGRRASCGLSRG